MTPLDELIDVVAAVIDDGGRILACRRRAELRAGGFWEFPGGKVELGETPAEALRREIREELGIEIVVGDELISIDSRETGIRLICLHAELVEGARPTVSTDHDRLEWMRPETLPRLDWAPADVPAVDLLVARGIR